MQAITFGAFECWIDKDEQKKKTEGNGIIMKNLGHWTYCVNLKGLLCRIKLSNVIFMYHVSG